MYKEMLAELEGSLERFKFKSSVKQKRVMPMDNIENIQMMSPTDFDKKKKLDPKSIEIDKINSFQ